MDKIKLDKITGSLVGLAIGDAMGAPYEFKATGYEVKDNYITGGTHNVSVGEWTDDTSMALCLAQSLIDNDNFNAKDQMDNYLSWYEDGYFSTRDRCFDIGNTVSSALRKYKKTSEPYSGIKGDNNSGNCSLMRLAPIALRYYNKPNNLIGYAAKSSQTTHKSELAVDSCIFYAQLIAGAINGFSKEKLLSKDFIKKDGLRSEVVSVINGSYRIDKLYRPTGYVINTLETALMAFYRFDNFKDGLLHVISLGDDTDTVGAVYSQLAGAYYGYSNIDQKYKKEVQKHDMIYSIAQKLYDKSIEVPQESIDKVLSFLPYFSDNQKFTKDSCGELENGVLSIPYIDYSDKVLEFLKILYSTDFIVNFNWAKWDEGREIISNNELIKQSDLLTLRKLLTAIVRNERFCEGVLIDAIENETIRIILESINKLQIENRHKLK